MRGKGVPTGMSKRKPYIVPRVIQYESEAAYPDRMKAIAKSLREESERKLSPQFKVEPQYIVVDQKTFTKEDLVLDNHVYKNCQMDKCRIYYSGGPFELIDTHITESELILNQPAKNIYAAIQIFRTKSPGSTIVFE